MSPKEKLSHNWISDLGHGQSLPLGIISGVLIGILGAVGWAKLNVATGLQFTFFALTIGFVVGFAIRTFGKGDSKIFGIWGAVITSLSCILGKVFSAIGIIANQEGLDFIEMLALLNSNQLPAIFGRLFSSVDFYFTFIAIYAGYSSSTRKISTEKLAALQTDKKTAVDSPDTDQHEDCTDNQGTCSIIEESTTLKNEEGWMIIPLEENSTLELTIESEVNDQLVLISLELPENCIVNFSRKINAPNLHYLLFRGKGAKRILNDFNSFFQAPLNFKHIEINCTEITKIPDFILENKNLTSLTFRSEPLIEMGPKLFQMQQLENLRFQYTESVRTVPDEIKNLQNLKAFDLWGTRLDYVSPELFKLPKLKHKGFAGTTFL